MFYYCYILQSRKNKKLYIGHTEDLKERVTSHNNGENKATKPNIPYDLIYFAGFKIEQDAIENEHYFKTTAGWKRIHKMLNNYLSDQDKSDC